MRGRSEMLFEARIEQRRKLPKRTPQAGARPGRIFIVRIANEGKTARPAKILGRLARKLEQRADQLNGAERTRCANSRQRAEATSAGEPQQDRLRLIAPRMRRGMRRGNQLAPSALRHSAERGVAKVARGGFQTIAADRFAQRIFIEPREEKRNAQRFREALDLLRFRARRLAERMIDVPDRHFQLEPRIRFRKLAERDRERDRIGAARASGEDGRALRDQARIVGVQTIGREGRALDCPLDRVFGAHSLAE